MLYNSGSGTARGKVMMMPGNAVEKYPTLNIRVSSELRARVRACAKAEGIRPSEYVRVALLIACQTTERRAGQRERALRKAEASDD